MNDYDEVMKNLEERFKECPEMPESLSKENIVKSIKQNNVKQLKKKRVSYIFEAVAAAVAVLVALGAVLGYNPLKADVSTTENATVTAITTPTTVNEAVQENIRLPQGVYSFENTDSVKEYMLEIYRENGNRGHNVYYDYGVGVTVAGTTVAAAMTEAPKAESATEDSFNTAADGAYTGTNVQVSGVDEGDIIKNDGRYIYLISGGGRYEPRVKIFDTETMETVYNGKIDSQNDDITIQELYVSGDTMTVIYTVYEKPETGRVAYSYLYVDSTTYIELYDITDRNAPKKISTTSQDGSFRNSRMIGSVLYTLSNYYVNGENEEQIKENAIPRVAGEEIRCDCIYRFDYDALSYTVISALDTSKPGEKANSVAVLDQAQEVYCSESTLYFLNTEYGAGPVTDIVAFSLDGTSVECTARGRVPGSFNNNYSFDEYKGYLRAATTDYDYTAYEDVCRIYVLDKNLEIVGKTENLAEDEQIKSVRFMGDKGYVVTFRQTDPLFSLDLSDPTNPKITGELKLPGYSTYLHPISDSMLLGIGYGGDEENADTNKLKIALFDISDMTSPALVDEFIIDSASSDVNYETKALIHYPQKNIIGIPVSTYHNYGMTRSFAIIDYTDNKLSSVSGFVHESEEDAYNLRGICIGDMLYTVDTYKIIEHSLENGEKQRECVILEENEKRYSEITVTAPAFIYD